MFRASFLRPVLTASSLFLLALAIVAADVTVVVDYKPAGSPNTTAITGDTISTFNFSAYGFANTPANFNTITASITNELRNIYYSIPTSDVDPRSPIPPGHQLKIDFVQGTIGVPPSNGATEYYYVHVGTGVSGPNVGGGTLGVARVSAIRTSSGADGNAANAAIVASVFTNAIQTLGGLTPANALTSGNLTFTTYAIAGTLAHEIGHTLSLSHMDKAGSVTPTGLAPIMGTGAIDLPNQDRIGKREFAYSGFNEQSGGAQVFHVQQLVNALGVRAVPEPMTVSMIGIALIAGAGCYWHRRLQLARAWDVEAKV